MEKGKNISHVSGNGSRGIDRNTVRILLMDTMVESCQEVLADLSKCSYQVIPIWHDAEIYEALSFKGPHTDIILAEVGLLMAHGAQMLKYIMRNKALQCIPVIMLSTQDQVSLVMKGLKLGAVDYLMKPLHATEISNIWMHTQKRCTRHPSSYMNVYNAPIWYHY